MSLSAALKFIIRITFSYSELSSSVLEWIFNDFSQLPHHFDLCVNFLTCIPNMQMLWLANTHVNMFKCIQQSAESTENNGFVHIPFRSVVYHSVPFYYFPALLVVILWNRLQSIFMTIFFFWKMRKTQGWFSVQFHFLFWRHDEKILYFRTRKCLPSCTFHHATSIIFLFFFFKNQNKNLQNISLSGRLLSVSVALR